jgi:hypothetical protein
MTDEYKTQLLDAWASEFHPGSMAFSNCRKSTEDIQRDLMYIVELKTNEIAEYLLSHGYNVDFSGNDPQWMLCKTTD